METTLSEEQVRIVQDILMQQLEVLREQVIPEAQIQADLGADSLDVVEISMRLEEAFEMTIPDEEWDSVRTVEELYAAVAGRVRSITH